VVKLLINQPNIDINIKSKNELTSLLNTAERGHKEIIELLLKHPKIDINIQDIQGYTALLNAATYGYKEIVELLLKEPNINVNLHKKKKMVILHHQMHSVKII